jgi:hypothetical protein
VVWYTDHVFPCSAANVAGTTEPVYGPSAIRSVAKQAEETPYTELTRDDTKWANMNSTSVETEAFYLMADNGYFAIVCIIHSNVAYVLSYSTTSRWSLTWISGIRTTSQFNTKIFYPGEEKPNLWSTDQLSEIDFSDDMVNYYAENCAIELSSDGKTYTIKSATNEASIVNITVTRTAPGFQAGKDGKSYYGTDPNAPWGHMRHSFWNRSKVEGTITTKDGPIDFAGKALVVHALQGMKPHHAAAKWTFGYFAGSKYSAIIMQFITPPSYGHTVVTVGGVVSDDEIIAAGASNTVTHTTVTSDAQNEWPEPTSVKFDWIGESKGGKKVEAILETPLKRLDKVDVMAEVPGFVKTLVASAVGTKPYIYQVKTILSTIIIRLSLLTIFSSVQRNLLFC